MRNKWITLCCLALLGACAGSEPGLENADLIAQADALTDSRASRGRGISPRETPHGLWRTKVYEQGAWVDLIWVIGKQRAWHVVTAYADEALTVPLLRWDIVRAFEIGGPYTEVQGARELTWVDLQSQLIAYVDDPALFASLGLNDCPLRVGTSHDLSSDNCGEPLFPFRDCELMDLVLVEGDTLTFGDPREGDRCVRRPLSLEAWSFERVPLTFELLRALLGE